MDLYFGGGCCFCHCIGRLREKHLFAKRRAEGVPLRGESHAVTGCKESVWLLLWKTSIL